MEEGGRQPNGKLAVTKKPGRRSDQPGNQRRLRVVSESELLRPHPILGLVREKVRRLQRQPNQPQRGNRRNPDERPNGIRADRPDVMLHPLAQRRRLRRPHAGAHCPRRVTPASFIECIAMASEPSMLMPRHASVATVTSNPDWRPSIAEENTQKSVASPHNVMRSNLRSLR